MAVIKQNLALKNKKNVNVNDELSEYKALKLPGWFVSILFITIFVLLVYNAVGNSKLYIPDLVLSGVGIFVLSILLSGFKIIQPGESLVLTFLGSYHGSVIDSGFHYINPFALSKKVSLKIVNLLTPILKVNDLSGNPVEVGASIAWQIDDTRKAAFGVQSTVEYIRVQSESALRTVVSSHPFDGVDSQKTLRENAQGIIQELMQSISLNVRPAGIKVIDAQIAHLAYAPEIASAMLKRQQAEQVIAAREVIVEGAVSMVKRAIEKLESEHVVVLEREDRVQLVLNLMTVLVSESEAQPVVQLGNLKN